MSKLPNKKLQQAMQTNTLTVMLQKKSLMTVIKMLGITALTGLLTACGEGGASHNHTNIDTLGPGMGGTGPFTTSSVEDLMVMDTGFFTTPKDQLSGGDARYSKPSVPSGSGATNASVSIQDIQPADKASYVYKKDYKISVTNQSPRLYCAGFERSIGLVVKNLMTTDTKDNTSASQKSDIQTEITVQTRVTNTLDTQLNETRVGCANYVLMNDAGLVYQDTTNQCQQTENSFQFQPKQTHEYQLKITALPVGSYKVRYTNDVLVENTGNKVHCDTFIEFDIQKTTKVPVTKK